MKSFRMSFCLNRAILAAALLSASVSAAQGATVFDQGPPNTAGGIRGDLLNIDDFTLSASSLLSGATFYLGYAKTDNTNLSISYSLYADGNGTPGTLLQSGSATPLITDLGPANENYTFNSWAFSFASPIQALADVRYWIGVQQGSDRVAVAQLPGGNPGAGAVYANNAGSYNPTGTGLAFSLQGTPVSAPVPEPATWGMMILGLGAVGFAMRRRRAAVTYRTA